jgi:hypothetical protein
MAATKDPERDQGLARGPGGLPYSRPRIGKLRSMRCV